MIKENDSEFEDDQDEQLMKLVILDLFIDYF